MNHKTNTEYFDYLRDMYHSESEDLGFVKWLDTGMMAIHLWEQMYKYFSANKTKISVESFVDKIVNSNIIPDLSFWIFNFQNFREKFNDYLIDDVLIRIEHLLLKLETIVVKYGKLIGSEKRVG